MIFKISDNELINDNVLGKIEIKQFHNQWAIEANTIQLHYDGKILGTYETKDRAQLELEYIYKAYSQGKTTYTMGVE